MRRSSYHDREFFMSPDEEKINDLTHDLDEAKAYIAKLESVLNELRDEFEDEMDADCVEGVMMPNQAMKIVGMIDEVLED